ncbi:porin [Roseomonas sp. USHLN139]|uniref:porin n=1 Tax=Roseomonas sp. USHLN139 TaxID=3081298 RepID=UPI003B02AF00
MRKILLGTTAVVGALVMASTGAMAQGADPFRAAGPAMMSHRDLEVRLGGFFRYYYSNTTQDFTNGAAGNLGKSDFQQETEIHIVANGKAANGLRYGVAVEIQNDNFRQAQSIAGSNTTTKTQLDLDEAWGYVAGSFGQLRFGDEDNVYGLMGQGYVANFASGGLDGDFYDSLYGQGRPALNMQSDAGDNTKIIYMSPQFAGFDFGASFAFNQGEGPEAGCGTTGTGCDRLASVAGGLIRRRNEVTAMLRYRGSFSGVGIGAHVGYMGADAIKNTTGISPDRMNLGLAGIQFTAFGFLVGGQYVFGDGNNGFSPRANLAGDSRQMNSFFTGVSYTYGDFTVGADYAEVRSAGNQSAAANGAALTGSRLEKGFNVGGTYRIAPGIEYIAEYTYIKREEAGFNFATGAANAAATRNTNNSLDANVFLTGFRFAF